MTISPLHVLLIKLLEPILAHALAAYLNDSLHVAALSSDQASRYLEVLVIGNLDIVPTRVLGLPIIAEVLSVALAALSILLSL